jgi:EAL domain-containing protein (putative c-di-GMP-specific phosphodiesterase class I)
MEIIAEGIEREEQLAELRTRGCRSGQGFLLARPAAPAAVQFVQVTALA